jgi:hypothetical protein
LGSGLFFGDAEVVPESLVRKKVFASTATGAIECMMEVDEELKGIFNASEKVGAGGNHHHCLVAKSIYSKRTERL